MGILASLVDFSFSCCGFFAVAGAGFRRAESAVELMEARFSGGSGLSRGEAHAGGDAHGAALDGPEPPEVLTNMRARKRGGPGGEFAPTAWISAFHQFRLWLLETFDPRPSLSSVLVDSRNKPSHIRSSRFSDRTLIPLSQAVGSGEGEVPLFKLRLFRPSNPSVRPPVGSTEVDPRPRRIREKTFAPRGGASSAPGRRAQHGALDHDAGVDVSPQRHEQLARQRDDHLLLLQLGRAPLVRSRYQRVSAEFGWWIGHNQANWIIVWRKR